MVLTMRVRTTEVESLVYSTEPAPVRARQVPRKPVGEGVVRIWLEKKGRNGTPVSIIRGLPNDRDALLALAARLKRACGTGGSAKDGEIIIQGDHRERIAATLAGEGLRVKLAGG
jgi:translation initiation factor 1